MTIETKYDLEQTVYFIKDNLIRKGIIKAVKTFNVGTDQDSILYNLSDWENPKTWLDYADIQQNSLYLRKEELLKSL